MGYQQPTFRVWGPYCELVVSGRPCLECPFLADTRSCLLLFKADKSPEGRRDRERERETERQTDGRTEGRTERERETDRDRERERESQPDLHSDEFHPTLRVLPRRRLLKAIPQSWVMQNHLAREAGRQLSQCFPALPKVPHFLLGGAQDFASSS